MLESLMNNWEYVLLVLYVVEKAIKLSPSKKDDLVWDMILKPIIKKIKIKKCLKDRGILLIFQEDLILL